MSAALTPHQRNFFFAINGRLLQKYESSQNEENSRPWGKNDLSTVFMYEILKE